MSQQATSRSSMSIGEVVDSLLEEFPDVSVSKVRFLEAEGLIEPDRTNSGYRKFSSADIARIRYILRLQRDQFLPLKVIRKRLEHVEPSEVVNEVQTDNGGQTQPISEDDEFGLATGLQLSFEDLVHASSLDEGVIRELEEYGLIDPHPFEGGSFYDEDDLMVAKIARDFSKYGIEPRHMKMYKTFADRESGIFEQIVQPLARASGDGTRQVTQSLNDLTKLSKRLKHILLRTRLRQHLHR